MRPVLRRPGRTGTSIVAVAETGRSHVAGEDRLSRRFSRSGAQRSRREASRTALGGSAANLRAFRRCGGGGARARCPLRVKARAWAPEAERLTLLFVLASSPLAPLLQRRRGGLISLAAGYPGWRSCLADPGLPSETPSECFRWRALRARMLLRRSGAGCRGPSRTGPHEAAIWRAVLAGGLQGAPTQRAFDAPRSRSKASAQREAS